MNFICNPKVSVIVPVCNVEKYLNQCIDSIINQTLKEIEIICVDVGSDDNSGSILDAYAKEDNRLKVIHEKRMDAGAARNIGLKVAKGEYLSILDSDDYFHPQMLEKSYKKAKQESADIVVYKSQEFDMRANKTKPLPAGLRIDWCPQNLTFHPSEMSKYLFNAFQNWAWNKLFRREFIIENNIWFQSVRRTNDMAFTCQALAMAKVITILPETFATYRTGTGTSLQSTNHIAPTSFWDAYMETKNRLLDAGLYETYKRSLQNTVLSGLMYNLGSVKTSEARRSILRIIKEESNKEFDLLNQDIKHFYNPLNYINYKNILNNEYSSDQQPNKSNMVKSMLKRAVKLVLDSDFVRYTRRFLIKIGIIKY